MSNILTISNKSGGRYKFYLHGQKSIYTSTVWYGCWVMLINSLQRITNEHDLPIVIPNTTREVRIVNQYSRNHMCNPGISPFIK